MAFLAALALAGWYGASSLSLHWREGAGAALTVQVPEPGDSAAQGGGTRLTAVLSELTHLPGVISARALPDEELMALLRPWLGADAERFALPLPAVVAVRLSGTAGDLTLANEALAAVAPGTMVEDHGIWVRRLAVLAASLRACAGMAVALVAAVAAAVIAVATRAGLAARREAIEIVHGLGATDAYIAGRFARRATMLAGVGGLLGAIAALPMLVTLAVLAAPFGGAAPTIETVGDVADVMPLEMWLVLPALPICAAAIGYVTARTTVRHWLRRLP